MAEGRDLVKDTTCRVCLESFQEPKVLPCCHSFCLKCLEGILETAENKTEIFCPTCKTKQQVPEYGVQGFLNDYTITTVLEDQHKTTSPPSCQQCSEGREAVTYCLTCSHLCEECHQAHKRLKIYRNHEIMDKEQLATSDTKPKRTYHCRIHPDNILTLYCKTCQSVACQHCHVTSHNGHNIGYINENRKAAEDAVNDCVKKLELKLEELEWDLQYIKKVEETKTEKSGLLKSDINQKVDSMIAQLEARRTELLAEVDDIFTRQSKELWAQKEYQETFTLRIKSALTFAERSLQCKDDTEALVLCTQVLTRLKELSQLKWDSESTEDIEVTCALWEPDTADLNTVGKLKSMVCTPVLQIISNDVPDTIKYYQNVAFRVTAEIIVSLVHSRVNSIKLEGQACCTGRKWCYKGNFQTFFNRSAAVSVSKDINNVWRVNCKPLSGTESISLTLSARGKYGKNTVSNTVYYTIQVDTLYK